MKYIHWTENCSGCCYCHEKHSCLVHSVDIYLSIYYPLDPMLDVQLMSVASLRLQAYLFLMWWSYELLSKYNLLVLQMSFLNKLISPGNSMVLISSHIKRIVYVLKRRIASMLVLCQHWIFPYVRERAPWHLCIINQ